MRNVEMDDMNRVARLMVDAEPAADLEARIRARLDEVAAVTPRRGSWQVVGVAAALALAAVWSWGPGAQRSGGPEVLGAGGPEVLASNISPVRTLPPLRHDTNARRAQPSALSVEELAWMDRRIPALNPIGALEMEQLAMTALIMTALPTDGGTTERRER